MKREDVDKVLKITFNYAWMPFFVLQSCLGFKVSTLKCPFNQLLLHCSTNVMYTVFWALHLAVKRSRRWIQPNWMYNWSLNIWDCNSCNVRTCKAQSRVESWMSVIWWAESVSCVHNKCSPLYLHTNPIYLFAFLMTIFQPPLSAPVYSQFVLLSTSTTISVRTWRGGWKMHYH